MHALFSLLNSYREKSLLTNVVLWFIVSKPRPWVDTEVRLDPDLKPDCYALTTLSIVSGVEDRVADGKIWQTSVAKLTGACPHSHCLLAYKTAFLPRCQKARLVEDI